jgi:hypothetical protein
VTSTIFGVMLIVVGAWLMFAGLVLTGWLAKTLVYYARSMRVVKRLSDNAIRLIYGLGGAFTITFGILILAGIIPFTTAG